MTGRDYFRNNFTGNDSHYDNLRGDIYCPNIAIISDQYLKDRAKEVRQYCKKNNIKFEKMSGTGQSYSAPSTSSNSENINITINENRGLSFWDYFLLSNLFSSRQQPIIINNAPGAAAYSTSSAQQEKSEGKTKENQTNKFLFFMALCVITHLIVCAAYHLYFKKEAEKSDKPIDYLANRQRDISVFQLALGTVSFIAASMFLSQSSVFFPFLVNTFICLGSSLLFYLEHNNTIENEVKPYMELAESLVKERGSPHTPESPPSYEQSQHDRGQPEPSAPSSSNFTNPDIEQYAQEKVVS